MAVLKRIYLPYYSSGASGIYARIFQVETGFWLDNTDGVFKALPTNPKIPMLESTAPSVYYLDEQRQVWPNGQYQVYGYDSVDYLFAGGELYILHDIEVSQSTLLEYVELVKKIEEGNWKLDATNKTWIYYDTDGVTPLVTFRVKDVQGNPSVVNIFKRERI